VSALSPVLQPAPAVPRVDAARALNRSSGTGHHLQQAARMARRNLLGALGAIIVVALVLIALLAGWLSPYDPNAQVGARLTDPGPGFALGLDQYGRDVLSRLIYGARTSLIISASSVGLALIVGGTLGLLAGYYRGWIDALAMRVMDVLFTLPSIILAIALAGLLGATLHNVILAVALVTAPSLARIARAPTLAVRQAEFVLSARAVGAGDARIMLWHVLPNVLAPIIVYATLLIPSVVVTEATLSFLGLGVPPPTATWGNMISEAQAGGLYQLAPWFLLFPSLLLLLLTLAFNLLGDGVRDAFDPRGDRMLQK
jgi:peptide/nickel transport system permease protein